MRAAIISIKLLFWFGVLLVPLTGVWLASSLAAYWNLPTSAALFAGALLFPILPVAWEIFARWRRWRKDHRRRQSSSFVDDLRAKKRSQPILTVGDRLLLRTLALNVAVLFIVGAISPKYAFVALSTRGDWMLDGVDAPWARSAREWLHGL